MKIPRSNGCSLKINFFMGKCRFVLKMPHLHALRLGYHEYSLELAPSYYNLHGGAKYGYLGDFTQYHRRVVLVMHRVSLSVSLLRIIWVSFWYPITYQLGDYLGIGHGIINGVFLLGFVVEGLHKSIEWFCNNCNVFKWWVGLKFCI